jgi:ABC-type uncharacterized transport system involved in gliding motility auxiliary subunit
MSKFISISGWLGLFFLLAGLFVYIVVPSETMIAGSLAIVGLLNGSFFVFSEKTKIKKVITGRTAVHGANSAILTIAFLGILVFVNLLLSRHNYRFDFTEGGIYTLSPQTTKVISSLDKDIKMTAFFQTEAPEKAEFQTLVDGYMGLSGKIDLNFVDPDKSPAITKQYGIKTYGTIALESGSNETKINNPTEDNLTNGILKILQDRKKTIYFLEGHGERNTQASGKEDYSQAKAALEKDGHAVKTLLLLQTAEIPQDADLVLISGPQKPLVDEEEKLLEAYLNKGGAVILLADPQTDPGLKTLLSKWGIELRNDLIIDPLSKLFGGDFAAPIVNQFAQHEIFKDFGLSSIFPLLRSILIKPTDGVITVELFKSGQNSWGETNVEGGKVQFDLGEDTQGPVMAAVIATKKMISPTQGEDNVAKETDSKEETKEGRLIVIGDSDFANNSYFGFSGNGDLFLNIASWMVEEKNRISIRPKEKKNNPIQLSRAQGTLIFLVTIIIIPGATLFAGFRTWWRRRGL